MLDYDEYAGLAQLEVWPYTHVVLKGPPFQDGALKFVTKTVEKAPA